MKLTAKVMDKKIITTKENQKFYTIEVYFKSGDRDGFVDKLFVSAEDYEKIPVSTDISNNVGLTQRGENLSLVYIK